MDPNLEMYTPTTSTELARSSQRDTSMKAYGTAPTEIIQHHREGLGSMGPGKTWATITTLVPTNHATKKTTKAEIHWAKEGCSIVAI